METFRPQRSPGSDRFLDLFTDSSSPLPRPPTATRTTISSGPTPPSLRSSPHGSFPSPWPALTLAPPSSSPNPAAVGSVARNSYRNNTFRLHCIPLPISSLSSKNLSLHSKETKTMLLQRLQAVDCLSPCGSSSSNKKQKKRRDGLPSRWLPSRISGQPDEEDCRDQSRSLINGSPSSSDMPPFTNKPPTALRRSSVESSPACRGGIPITPSPICSPSSTHNSFATPIQSSCMVVSKGLMRQCSKGGWREEEANVDCRKASIADQRGPEKQTRGSKSHLPCSCLEEI